MERQRKSHLTLEPTLPPKQIGAQLELKKNTGQEAFIAWAGCLMYVKCMDLAESMAVHDNMNRKPRGILDYMLYEEFWMGFILPYVEHVMKDKDFPFPKSNVRIKTQFLAPIFDNALEWFLKDKRIAVIQGDFIVIFRKLQHEIVTGVK
jgi:hypothetical protein